MNRPERILALCGGVGGAKLVLGLNRVLAADNFTVVVNTGDDFEHLGLRICPDIDTVTYTLAGIVNPQTGWGRAEESGQFMAALAGLGGENWFYLGDRDLALHVERSWRLRAGEKLDSITAGIARGLGVKARILPMSNDPVATMVETVHATLAFQHYFVRERCEPPVRGFHFAGIEKAQAHPELLNALADDSLRAVIICPSNPFVSVAPIVGLPGVRDALRACPAPIVAVSPIVGGQAVKGPTAKMMVELGLQASPVAVAKQYADFIDGFVLDHRDEDCLEVLRTLVPQIEVADTLMVDTARKITLAGKVLDFAQRCR